MHTGEKQAYISNRFCSRASETKSVTIAPGLPYLVSGLYNYTYIHTYCVGVKRALAQRWALLRSPSAPNTISTISISGTTTYYLPGELEQASPDDKKKELIGIRTRMPSVKSSTGG